VGGVVFGLNDGSIGGFVLGKFYWGEVTGPLLQVLSLSCLHWVCGGAVWLFWKSLVENLN